MPERPLLLSSARSGVLVSNAPSPWWRRGAIAFGLVAVLVGAADVLGRLSEVSLDGGLAFTAFAPAAALNNPSAFGSLTGSFAATSSVSFVPVQIRIPSLGVDAAVEKVGKKPNGEMGTPSTFSTVAWYSLGPKPGEPGNAVFAGHVNNALGLSGVFQGLVLMRVGDKIEVVGPGGEELSYVVTHTAEYPTNGAPLEDIFATTGPASLVLVTCEGEWDSSARSYEKRRIVVARLDLP